MNILKDKIIFLILLTALGIVYLIATRGHWETNLKQKWAIDKNRIDLSENVSIESAHRISPDGLVVGSDTYLFVKNACIRIDTLSIRMFEVINGHERELRITKRRISDMHRLVFDSQYNLTEDNFLKSIKIELCPGQRIEISSWFNYTETKTNDFVIEYNIRERNSETVSKRAKLEKERELEISGKHHYDYIILLYPVLWILLGLLIIVKTIKIVRSK